MELILIFISFIPFAVAMRGNAITDDAAPRGPVDCRAERDVGSCASQEEAWYYNASADQCHFFVYSGCGGNTNRFPSRMACEEACQKLRCPVLDCPDSCTRGKTKTGCDTCNCSVEEAGYICGQPLQRGYCRALHYRWAWDAAAKTCSTFVYGGCGGTENNFETKEMCLSVCKRTLDQA
ncbi:thrombin inhibitor hemalin [Penaeus vannamei]|uniref:thrombin inhibitor hemalin n=1 Tax=Penaeus vannamei TaxID=6689 RepID=UPI00387FAAB9